MTDKEYKLCKKALEKWGINLQLIVMIEEMAELIKVLCKHLREGPSPLISLMVSEEMADVTLMLDQLRVVYNNDRIMDEYRAVKIQRLKDRLKEGR